MTTLLVAPRDFDFESVAVSGDEYRHLFRALRLRTGDSIRVVDGEGRARAGVIESVSRDSAVVVLGESQPSREAHNRVELAVAQPRPERARWLVEKATELGVDEIVWFESQRGQQRWPKRLFGRLERVGRSAVEQSGRARLPRMDRLLSWNELIAGISESSATFLAHPTGYLSELSQADGWPPTGDCRIVVGPEGGFTDSEVQEAVAAGARIVGLGERILRIETAAVALLSILLARDSKD